MPGAHSLLAPSAAERWLNCPPSARQCENAPDTTSDYARQGTAAHALCEYRLRVALGESASDPTETLDFYDDEMSDCADEYVAFVVETASAHTDPIVLIEQRVDMSRWVPEASGTCDCCIIGDGVLHVIDYKHGIGVPVSAEENPQFRMYALGALEAFDFLYDVNIVRMTVFQPRLNNVSTCEMSKESLLEWAEEVLKPTAELAFSGDGDYKSGAHCRFCKIKAECRERADENLKLAAYDFTEPALLEPDEIASVLGKIDALVAWAGDVKEFALTEALRGVKFDGFKVVEGRSNRVITDESDAATALAVAGYHGYMSEPKLLGITALEKLVGKTKLPEVIGQYIAKPAGKPALVPESDKRQELSITTAAEDFADHNN
jgi:hypothetical protein